MSETDLLTLARGRRRDTAAPFLTFYDDATGERVELSAATFGNWVAKTANLIQDVLAAEPGDRVAILLPPHWQTVVWLVACWEAGVVAAPGHPPRNADHVVVGPDTLERANESSGERVALSLRPLGGGFQQPLPAGVLDYATEVPGQPDTFTRYGRGAAPGELALMVDGRAYTHGELVTAGREAAATLGLTVTSRILTAVRLDTWDGLRTGLLAPLAAGASIVLCRRLDRSLIERRVATERITHSVL